MRYLLYAGVLIGSYVYFNVDLTTVKKLWSGNSPVSNNEILEKRISVLEQREEETRQSIRAELIEYLEWARESWKDLKMENTRHIDQLFQNYIDRKN